jgi:hypothetical protein
MVGLLKSYGMVVLTFALGVATFSLAILGGASGDVERPQVALLLVAGLLTVGGLAAMRLGVRGARFAVGLGAIVPGLVMVWTVVAPIITLAILTWLFGGRQVRQVPAQPA